MRIHVIDMVQPPGIAMPSIVVIDTQQAIVAPVLTANSSAATPRNACGEAGDAARSEIRECGIGGSLLIIQCGACRIDKSKRHADYNPT
jgi:hypothetical protein